MKIMRIIGKCAKVFENLLENVLRIKYNKREEIAENQNRRYARWVL